MKDFEVSIEIAEKNKKALWDILESFDRQLSELQSEIHKRKIEQAKDIVDALQLAVNWADDYPDARQGFQENARLWEIARDFIKSKKLDGEFNALVVEKMKEKE